MAPPPERAAHAQAIHCLRVDYRGHVCNVHSFVITCRREAVCCGCALVRRVQAIKGGVVPFPV